MLNGEYETRHREVLDTQDKITREKLAELGWMSPEDAASVKRYVLRLQDEAITLRKATIHWRANHDNQVKRARFLIERDDLPVERVSAYEEMGRLQAKVEELERKRRAFLETIDRFERTLIEIEALLTEFEITEHVPTASFALNLATSALRSKQKIE